MEAWTVVGNLGGADDVLVDEQGRVRMPGGWTLDWWVVDPDRRPAGGARRPSAVTQRRIDGAPVVETATRVPSGQFVHRAWCVSDRSGDVAVIEVENRSRDALAIAAVVEGARRIAHDGERIVLVDGAPGPVFARAPARAASGSEIAPVVGRGDAPAPVAFDRRVPEAAFIFPLAHTARLRVAVPLAAGGTGLDVEGLPDAETVARGWRAHLDAGVRAGLPDERLAESIIAARTTLLVRSDRPRPAAEAAPAALALGLWGHHGAARPALLRLVEQQRLDGLFGRKDRALTATVLAAWAVHARATGDAGFAEALAGPAAKAAHRLDRAHRRAGVRPAWTRTAQLDAADVLDVAGQPEAAQLCRERAETASEPDRPVDPATLAIRSTPAELLHAVRRLLVDDGVPGELAVLRAFPDDWLGQEVEAHRVPTRAGLLSYAIRWHGARPAILWERTGGSTTRLTVPGLDPGWSSVDAAGEALLGLVEPAGGLPKVVAPLPANGTPVDEAPGDGVSFH